MIRYLKDLKPELVIIPINNPDIPRTSSYYEYDQNNSGGLFDIDEEKGIGHLVVIQAYSANEANRKAQEIGLYFDGDGDCSCCGNRWWEHSALAEGSSFEDIAMPTYPSSRVAFVHLLDDRILRYGV